MFKRVAKSKHNNSNYTRFLLKYKDKTRGTGIWKDQYDAMGEKNTKGLHARHETTTLNAPLFAVGWKHYTHTRQTPNTACLSIYCIIPFGAELSSQKARNYLGQHT